MLSVYYGFKSSQYVYDNTYRIGLMEDEIKFGLSKSYHEKQIPNIIKQLKDKNSYLLYKTYRVTDTDIYICEVRNAEILNVNDKVKLFDKEGTVHDRKYDATKNIMHFYTDIIMEKVESEEVDRELEEKTIKAIDKLEKIHKKYFNEFSEKVKNKNWFKRLFG